MHPQPTFIPYEHRLNAAYHRFAGAQYGAGCYQASASYLDWLYDSHEGSKGLSGFLVGVIGDEVIACIHKMYLPWTIGGQSGCIPSLHNWMVKEEYRSGTGFWLLKQSLRGETHAVIPGVLPPLIGYLRTHAVPASS